MSTVLLLTQDVTTVKSGLTDGGLATMGAYLAGGLMLAGGAIGAAQGNGTLGAAVIEGVARQPAAQSRLTGISFVYIGLVEAAYFINLAFMALMIFALGA